jgi:hypothetical protein
MPGSKTRGVPAPIHDVEHFETRDGFAIFRPVGRVSVGEAIERVTAALNSARQQGIQKIIVVTSGLTGFPSPSLGTRYFFVHEWARAAQGRVIVAIVARPEMIDPKKFGVAVANSAGMTTDVFTTEDEAVAWLSARD